MHEVAEWQERDSDPATRGRRDARNPWGEVHARERESLT